ncbi:MAG TPA: hypothetical protein VEL31_25490 [Ktedonobacteraceae bacterium]|nr:hypothetical protein [Ktedonobacteraceae bacterium]
MPEQNATFHFLIDDVSHLSVSELASALTSIAKQLEQWPDEVFIEGGMRIDGIVEIETQRRSSHALRYYAKLATSSRTPELR